MALGQEGIAVVAAAAVLHPISLPQWQQQNWCQPGWKQWQQNQQDTQMKQGTWKRWSLVPQKGREFSPASHPAPLEQGASVFARDHLDFGLAVSCLALLNL